MPESLQKRMQTVTFRYAFTKSPNLANRCNSIKQQRCRPSCRWWMIQTDREQPKIVWNRLKQIGIKQARARVHFSDHIWGYQGLSWIIYGTLPPEEKCNWMLWRCPKACKNACKLWPSSMLLPRHQISFKTYLSIYLPIFLSIYPGIHLSIHPSNCLCIYLSINRSIFLCFYLQTFFYLYIHIYIYTHMFISICIYIYIVILK